MASAAQRLADIGTHTDESPNNRPMPTHLTKGILVLKTSTVKSTKQGSLKCGVVGLVVDHFALIFDIEALLQTDSKTVATPSLYVRGSTANRFVHKKWPDKYVHTRSLGITTVV